MTPLLYLSLDEEPRMSLHDPLIRKLMTRQDLTRAESADLMADLMSTDVEGWRFMAFSVASQTKGETAEELLGMYDGMLRLTGPYGIQLPARVMDVSSTGGSGVRKINVSTLTALITGDTDVAVVKHGEAIDFVLEPEAVGLKRVPQSAVQPADAHESLGDFLRILCGREKGPKRDLAALNSGVVFYLTDRTPTIEAGIELAIRRLESGEIEQKLDTLVAQMGSPETLAAARREYLSS